VANSKKGGLGRGLGSLIPTEPVAAPEVPEASSLGLRELEIQAIEPNRYQPRDHFDEEDLQGLAASIRELGVLQPILVREREPGDFELIAGERRWRAAQLAGLSTIPAVVREVEDQTSLEHALVENLHRADLNAIEEAAAYQQLMDDFGMTQDQVAARVGKSRSAVANTLRLFQLPAGIQRMIIESDLSAGHGRALLQIDGPEQELLARRVLDEGLSVRSLEALVRGEEPGVATSGAATDAGGDDDLDLDDGGAGGGASSDSSVGATRPAALLELEHLLADYLETRVSVQLGAKRGRIAIDFADIDDLERVARLLMGPG